MEHRYIQAEGRDGVAQGRFKRPEKLNVLNRDVFSELAESLRQ